MFADWTLLVAMLAAVSSPSEAPPAAVDLGAAARTSDEVKEASARDGGGLWGVKLDGPVNGVEVLGLW